MDKYLSKSIGTDFIIGDSSFHRWNFKEGSPNALTEELINEIRNIDGIGRIDKGIYDILEKFVVEGEFNKAKFKTGAYIIVDSKYIVGSMMKVGDKVINPFDNGESKNMKF